MFLPPTTRRTGGQSSHPEQTQNSFPAPVALMSSALPGKDGMKGTHAEGQSVGETPAVALAQPSPLSYPEDKPESKHPGQQPQVWLCHQPVSIQQVCSPPSQHKECGQERLSDALVQGNEPRLPSTRTSFTLNVRTAGGLSVPRAQGERRGAEARGEQRSVCMGNPPTSSILLTSVCNRNDTQRAPSTPSRNHSRRAEAKRSLRQGSYTAPTVRTPGEACEAQMGPTHKVSDLAGQGSGNLHF